MRRAIAVALIGMAACAGHTGFSLGGTGAGAGAGTEPVARGAAGASEAPGQAVLVVPDLSEMTVVEARAAIARAGFESELEVYPDGMCHGPPPGIGRVYCQRPSAGEKLSRGGFVQVHTYAPPGHAGRIIPEEARPAIGMTVADAKALFKRLGHVGPVRIADERLYDPACGQGRVCSLDWDGAIKLHDELVMRVNPKLELAAPPVE